MTLTVTAGPYFIAKMADAVNQGAFNITTEMTAALADYELKASVAADAKAAIAAKTEVAALSAGPTTTATTGSLPTANGSITIANAATPTVAELLEFCIELKAKVDAITAALKA